MDKSWLYIDRVKPEFAKGLTAFKEYARQFLTSEGTVRCPCAKCCNTTLQTLDEMYDHCYSWGWSRGYDTWFLHGESEQSSRKRARRPEIVVESGDEMGPVINDFMGGDPEEEILQPEDDDKYEELISALHERVYPGCENSSLLKQEKSEVNTQNSRGNKKGTHGRKTIDQRRYQGIQDNDTVIGENVIERDPIDLWAEVRRHADGTWVDAQAENDHRMLEYYRSNITPGPRRKLTQEEEDLIFSSALGDRRDYYIGRGPRMAISRASASSIPSSSSCATSSYRDAEVDGLKKKLAKLKKATMKQKTMLDFFFAHYNKTNNTTFGIDDDDDDDDDDGDDEDQGDGTHDGSQT